MTPEQFRQVETLFHRGKDLPPDEQRTLLDAECGDDPEVRAEVEKLLALTQLRRAHLADAGAAAQAALDAGDALPA